MRSPALWRAGTLVLAMAYAAVSAWADQHDAEAIASLVAQLGHEQFETREAAMDALWRIGEPTRPLLVEARGSRDPEVRMRADQVLALLDLGVTPAWPVELIRTAATIDDLPERERRQMLMRLADDLGADAVAFLLRRLPRETQSTHRRMVDRIRNMGKPGAEKVIAHWPEPQTQTQRSLCAWAYRQLDRPLDALRMIGDADDPLREHLIADGVKAVTAAFDEDRFDDVVTMADAYAALADDPRFDYLAAEALTAMDRDDEAARRREDGFVKRPDDAAVQYNTAQMLHDMGRFTIAEPLWRRILGADDSADVYVVNAYFRLGTIYAHSHRHADAAQMFERGLRMFQEEKIGALTGGSVEDLRAQIVRQRKWADKHPHAQPLRDKVSVAGFELRLQLTVKDNKSKEMIAAINAANGSFTATIQPRDLRLLDLDGAGLRYDPQASAVVMMLNGETVGDPVPINVPEEAERHQLIINLLDCVYLYEVDLTGGAVEKVARYEKDYRVQLKPGLKLRTLKDVTLTVNGQATDWATFRAGVAMDYLPETFEITIEGVTPAGQPLSVSQSVKVTEPNLGDASAKTADEAAADHEGS